MWRTFRLNSYRRQLLKAPLFLGALLSILFPNMLAAEGGDVVRGKVVATTNIVADLVTQIAGDLVQIDAIMGPGVDPHLYKATHGDLGRLEKADVIFYNGLHLEGKMHDVLEKLGKKKRSVAVTRAIDPAALRAPPEFQGNYDPHVWFDVKLWEQTVPVVVSELSAAFPNLQQSFHTNGERYRKELHELESWIHEHLALVPPEQRLLLTAHDAFGYFGHAYGIEVKGLQGISTAGEIGLRDVTSLVDLVIQRKTKAIFVESSVPRRFIEALQEGVRARGGSVAIGGELYSDALGEKAGPAGTYAGMIRHNVATIVNALK